jgi:hypothetical protein
VLPCERRALGRRDLEASGQPLGFPEPSRALGGKLQRARAASGRPGVPERLPLDVSTPLPELLEVLQRLDLVSGNELGDLLRAVACALLGPARDAQMHVGTEGLRQRVVRTVPDEGVPEREFVLVAERGGITRDDELLDAQPAKRVSNLGDRLAGQFDDSTNPEDTSHDGRVLEDLLLVVGQAVEARRDESLHGAGEFDPGDRPGDLPAGRLGCPQHPVVDQLADDLLDVQRVALAALDDRPLELSLNRPRQ